MEQSSNTKIFQNLVQDITNLIKNLEIELLSFEKNIEKTTQAPGKLNIFQKLKSIWPFRNFFGGKPTLKEYLEFNNKIKNICDQIIVENFTILESNNQISNILNKFNDEFKKIIMKYANFLQKDYEAERAGLIKKTGAPDETSASVIQDTQQEASLENDKIQKSISRVLETKERKDYIVNEKWFNNGEIIPDFFGEVLDYLINNDIDIKDENEIKNAFSGKYSPNPTKTFYSKILRIFGSEESVDKLEAKIINRDIIIGSVEELIKKIKTSFQDKEKVTNILKQILEIDKNENVRRRTIIEAKKREAGMGKDIEQTIFWNVAINDDLRRALIESLLDDNSAD